jgi:hypothetical protein
MVQAKATTGTTSWRGCFSTVSIETDRLRTSDAAEVAHSTISSQQLLDARILEVCPAHDSSADLRGVGLFSIALGCQPLAVFDFNHRTQVLGRTAVLPIWVLPSGTGLQEDCNSKVA